jgi:acetolactate synthase I/II/III large subunit
MANVASLRVADLVVDALARAGAETVFAAFDDPGVAALTEAATRRGLRMLHAAHAAAACVMASVTGLLTDAPGAAVLSLEGSRGEVRAALDQATRDRAPLVVVTDRPFATPAEGLVKASLTVEVGAVAHWSAHAIQSALAEPRGPVHLVVAPDTASERAVPLATSVRPGPLPAPDSTVLDEAANLLAGAEHPVLIAGLQCRTLEVAGWLRALAESLPAPALVTARGKGALPDPHPLHLGLIGYATSADSVLGRADLVVTIGVDAVEMPRPVWPGGAPVLHLAASPWAGAEEPRRTAVVGDIALIIEELAPRLRGRSHADWDVAQLDRLKRASAAPLASPSAEGRLPFATVVRVVREAMPAGTVAIAAVEAESDVVVAAWHAVAPGELVVPALPALPGFALPASLAAQVARPQARAVCFASARQLVGAAGEFDTLARLALPVLVLMGGGPDEGAAEAPPRSAQRAGWMVMVAHGETALRMAIERALSATRPALVDVRESSR